MATVNRPSREAPRPGRPSTYTEALADEIYERLACGESLRSICDDEGMPDKATVMRWRLKNNDFRAKYDEAREVQREVWADEIVDLARSEPPRNPVTGQYDWAAVKHIRNQVATLRWLMQKLSPKTRSNRIGADQ